MTQVLDASAIGELLLSTSTGQRISAIVGDDVLYAPAHMPAEVLSVLRGWYLRGDLSSDDVTAALQDLHDLHFSLVDLDVLMADAWALRENVSAYDALYIALAQALGTHVLTADRRLARAAPDHARVP